jgi:hypothetical protein
MVLCKQMKEQHPNFVINIYMSVCTMAKCAPSSRPKLNDVDKEIVCGKPAHYRCKVDARPY